jgi:nucleotide-binding universal stress UspA family protein
MAFRTILAATDFSPYGRSAVDHALVLAQRSGAELVLLHVWGAMPPLAGASGASGKAHDEFMGLYELRRTAAARELQRLHDELRARGISLASQLREGDAARTISSVARELDADLIVVGAHGAAADNVFVIGSVAEGILRLADTNVLVARGDAPKEGFHSILVGTDLTPASTAVVPLAMEVAAPDVDVELMHVVDWGEHPPPVRRPSGSPRRDFEALWRATITYAEHQLAELMDRLGRAGATLHHRVVEGLPAVELLLRLRANEHDLLVLGKHSPSLPRHERVAERVTRQAPCSVLVARRAPR